MKLGLQKTFSAVVSSMLSLGLLMTPASALTTDFDFNTSGEYSFDGNDIQVTTQGELKGTFYVDDTYTGEFDQGTPSEISWDAVNEWLELSDPVATTVGTFISRVMDSTLLSKIWTGVGWVPAIPYGKPLPGNQGVESGYTGSFGNTNMSSNQLLLHLDESSGTSLADSSGNGNNAACTNCPTLGADGIYNSAVTFDGVNDVVSIPDDNSLDLTSAGTVEAWIKIEGRDFAYKRPLTLSTATTRDDANIMLEFDNTDIDYTKLQADGDDIRFLDSTGRVLPYWIEYWKEGASEETRLWVKIFETGTTAIDMYYGNTEVDQGSTGKDTFVAFMDPSGQRIGYDDWNLQTTNTFYGSGLNYYEDDAFVMNGFLNNRIIKSNDRIPFEGRIEMVAKYTISEIENTGSTRPALCNVVEGYWWNGSTWRNAGDDFFCWNSSTTSTRDKSYGIDASFDPGGSLIYDPGRHVGINEDDELVANDDVRLAVQVGGDDLSVNVTGDKTYTNSWTATDTEVATHGDFGFGVNYNVTQKIYWAFVRNVDEANPSFTLGAEAAATQQVPDTGGWMYERTLTVTGTVPEDDFQLKVELPSDFPGKKVADNKADMRFIQASDGQELPFWIGSRGTLGGIWVKLANKDETTVIMQYGNPHIQKHKWSGEDVFDFYEDFTGETMDMTKWSSRFKRGDEAEYTDETSVPLNNGRVWRYLGRFQSGAQNGYRWFLETKESFTGYKAIHVRYSKTNNNEGYFCFRYGEDGDYSGFGQLNVSYMNVHKGDLAPGYDAQPCPAAFSSSYSTGAATDGGVSVSHAGGTSTYSVGNEEFQVAPDGIRRHHYVYGYAEGIGQTTTKEYINTSTAVRTPNNQGTLMFYTIGGWYGDNTQIFDEIVIRKQTALDQEPSLVANSDERMIGAGKHGGDSGYGITLSGNKAYVTFGKWHLGAWLYPGWNHIMGTYDGDKLKLFEKGENTVQIDGVPNMSANTNAFEIGGFVGGALESIKQYAHASFDELAVYNIKLTNDDARNHYRRGALDLKFQIRSCDDAACDTEEFVGPDGTSSTYYTEEANTGLTPYDNEGVNVGTNQYAQYKAYFTGDGTYSPELSEVSILPGNYPDDAPSIEPNSGQAYQTIGNFLVTLGTPSTGIIEYQITNNGTDWYYWDTGSNTWVVQTGTGYNTETSTAAEIASNIRYFASQVGSGTFNFRAFLGGNGGQSAAIDNIQLTYGTTDTAPGAPTTLYVNEASGDAQSGDASPATLTSTSVKFSALYNDADAGDYAANYQLEIATDNGFSNIIYDSTKTAFSFGTEPLAGERTPDISIPNGTISPDTTYYWRLTLWDAKDNTGTTSATAEFSAPDNNAPALGSSSPSDGDTGVSKATDITLNLTDDVAGIDISTLDVTIEGGAAITNGVCQAGYACTIPGDGTSATVVINPDTDFAFSQNVNITYEVDDLAGTPNTLSGTIDFDIGINGAPTAPTGLYINDASTGAQTGLATGATVSTTDLVVSAVHTDPDSEAASKYRLQIATDDAFTSITFDTNTDNPGGVPIAPNLAHNTRSSDISIANAGLSFDTTYYWRIKFWDVNDAEGVYSPSGGSAASFTLADQSSPSLSSSTPADASQGASTDASITLNLSDPQTGLNQTTLNVEIGGTDAILLGVCQAGFVCTLTPAGNDLTVEITPDSSFSEGETITVNYDIADNGATPNTLMSSISFTTAEPQAVPVVRATGGGGGGGAAAGGSAAINATLDALFGRLPGVQVDTTTTNELLGLRQSAPVRITELGALTPISSIPLNNRSQAPVLERVLTSLRTPASAPARVEVVQGSQEGRRTLVPAPLPSLRSVGSDGSLVFEVDEVEQPIVLQQYLGYLEEAEMGTEGGIETTGGGMELPAEEGNEEESDEEVAGEEEASLAPSAGPSAEEYLETTLETLSTFYFPELGGETAGTPGLPQRNKNNGAPLTVADSMCSKLGMQYDYLVSPELPKQLREEIAILHKFGVNFSNPGGVLDVDRTITRSELLKYLLQMTCADYGHDVSGVPRFPDVVPNHEHDLFIHVGRKYGLVTGYIHDGLFRPDQNISMAEALKVTLKYMLDGRVVLDGDMEVFDNVNYEQWFGPYIRFASEKGIVKKGRGFNPYQTATLEDIISLLVGALTLRGQ